MALSNNILSKFAKTVTKKETKNKETIVYGKISRYDEDTSTWYVTLDGAPEGMETPISSFTASIDLDQRVIVMIKNHSAIVTGNIEAPATSQEYVDGKVYNTIGRDVNVIMGPTSVQNYYSIEFDEEGNPIYKIVDNTSVEGTKEMIYKIATEGNPGGGGECESVDLTDIRALWPDYNYE